MWRYLKCWCKPWSHRCKNCRSLAITSPGKSTFWSLAFALTALAVRAGLSCCQVALANQMAVLAARVEGEPVAVVCICCNRFEGLNRSLCNMNNLEFFHGSFPAFILCNRQLIVNTCSVKNLQISDFELWISGMRSNCSANWATTTAGLNLNEKNQPIFEVSFSDSSYFK